MSFSLQSYNWYASQTEHQYSVSRLLQSGSKKIPLHPLWTFSHPYLDGNFENSFNIFCMFSNLGTRNFVPRDIWQSFVLWIGDQKWKSQQLISLSSSVLVQLKGNNNVVIGPYL